MYLVFRQSIGKCLYFYNRFSITVRYINNLIAIVMYLIKGNKGFNWLKCNSPYLGSCGEQCNRRQYAIYNRSEHKEPLNTIHLKQSTIIAHPPIIMRVRRRRYHQSIPIYMWGIKSKGGVLLLGADLTHLIWPVSPIGLVRYYLSFVESLSFTD